jgi:LysM repeat protein
MQVATRHSTGSHHASRTHAGTQTATATKATTPNAVLHHRVKRGETLSSIATSYNTTVSALKHDNRNIAALRPGMILVVRSIN